MSNEQNQTAPFELRTAVRSSLKPLVGFYGLSGGGKTLSALLFARGIVGPAGKIGVLDSENRRASIFADLVPGGFLVADLDEPFSPDRYQEAMALVEKDCDIVVVDSFSHEWTGPGGVLDWQEAEFVRLGNKDSMKLLSWQAPKRAHKQLVQWMLRCSKPLIVCLRGEQKTHFDQDANGKKTVITDKFSSPIQDPRFIFEMLINFEMVSRDVDGRPEGGFVIPRKVTHPDVWKILPKENEQIGIAHGKALADWCNAVSKPLPAGGTAGGFVQKALPKTGRPLLLEQMRDLTTKVHEWKKGDRAGWPLAKQRLTQWLIDEAIISDTQTLDSVTDDELAAAIEKVKTKLNTLL